MALIASARTTLLRENTMRIVVAFFLGFVVCAAPASAQDSPAPAHGEKVYAAQKCGACHSVGAIGNKKGPLDGVGTRLTGEEIRQWLVDAPEMAKKTKATRKPLMKSYTQLSKPDIDALVAYLQSMKKS
jgi:mono/diheme cytochrome c family protein